MWRTATIYCLSLFLAASALGAEGTKNFRFSLQVPGLINASFSEVSGLTSDSNVAEYREGTSNLVRKLPGLLKYGNITLKRGLTTDKSLATWRGTVENESGDVRVNAALVLFNHAGVEIARWHLINAWPHKLSVEIDPERGVVIETLVLAVDDVRRQ